MNDGGPDRPPGLLAGLAVTETVSWGICYYGFAVLLPPMERELGWSRATFVGAFTIAIVVSGLAAFPVGRGLDRGRARLLMTSGSVLATIGLVAWSQARTVAAFYGAWLLIGVAMALVLYEPAQVVLVKQYGRRATKAITALTLVAGLASTIFQPTTAALQQAVGWRSALVILAVGLGVVTITIHALVLPRHDRLGREPVPRTRRLALPTIRRPWSTPAPPEGRGVADPAMVWITVAFTLSSAAMAAAIVHLIPYLTDQGWTDVGAAVAAGVIGITQVAARIVFGVGSGRVRPPVLALAVLLVPVGGVIVLALSSGVVAAWTAIVLLGIGQGTATLLRPLVLSSRLPPAEYGRGAASSAAWSTVARAVSPLLLAGAAGLGASGYTIGFAVCAVVGTAGAVIAALSLRLPAPTHAPARSASPEPHPPAPQPAALPVDN